MTVELGVALQAPSASPARLCRSSPIPSQLDDLSAPECGCREFNRPFGAGLPRAMSRPGGPSPDIFPLRLQASRI
jgi:hypothetical protein